MKLLTVKKMYFILILAYVIILFFSCKTIETRTYPIKTRLLAENSSIRIVQISDLHCVIYGEKQNLLIDKIIQLEPDLIFLTGDIFDYRASMYGTQLFLAGISGIAPFYFVMGNHEYASRKLNEIKEMLKFYEVNILSDEYVSIRIKENEIILAGIEDPIKKILENRNYDQDSIMETRFRELDNIDKFKILLAHRPERIDSYKKFSFDLIFSGHTHGGQIRIPYLINGVYAPDQGLFPKYGGGLYEHGSTVHIISRGLSIKKLLPRIFNSPEIVVVKIYNPAASFEL